MKDRQIIFNLFTQAHSRGVDELMSPTDKSYSSSEERKVYRDRIDSAPRLLADVRRTLRSKDVSISERRYGISFSSPRIPNVTFVLPGFPRVK